jgi:subtilisin family serine protease
MKLQIKIALLAIFAILMLFEIQSQAQNDNMGRYIVTIQRPIGNAVRGAGGRVIHEYSIIPAISIEIPESAIQGLSRNPNVIRIEPDAEAWALPSTNKTPPGLAKKPSPPPPPPPSGQQLPWGVNRIDAELAWNAGYKGANVKVAVIDTGIDLDHPDLNPISGYDFVNDDPVADDDNGHGTHVAGIIAALNNEIGVVGVAPDASLYAVKVLDSTGSGYYSDIIAGIEWCVINQIAVVNMSLGGTYNSPDLEAACNLASKAGVLLVASAGNSGNRSGRGDNINYPAKYDCVIAVAATDSSDNRASFSSTGLALDIAAPGVSIYSTYKGGVYATMSGTSMAAPHVTGTLALLLSGNILETADDLGSPEWDSLYGWGLVDAEESATGYQTNP